MKEEARKVRKKKERKRNKRNGKYLAVVTQPSHRTSSRRAALHRSGVISLVSLSEDTTLSALNLPRLLQVIKHQPRLLYTRIPYLWLTAGRRVPDLVRNLNPF